MEDLISRAKSVLSLGAPAPALPSPAASPRPGANTTMAAQRPDSLVVTAARRAKRSPSISEGGEGEEEQEGETVEVVEAKVAAAAAAAQAENPFEDPDAIAIAAPVATGVKKAWEGGSAEGPTSSNLLAIPQDTLAKKSSLKRRTPSPAPVDLKAARDISSVNAIRKVNFWQWVDVGFSHSSDEYDRIPIEPEPLTKEGAMEVISMRLEMRRVTQELHRWRDEYERATNPSTPPPSTARAAGAPGGAPKDLRKSPSTDDLQRRFPMHPPIQSPPPPRMPQYPHPQYPQHALPRTPASAFPSTTQQHVNPPAPQPVQRRNSTNTNGVRARVGASGAQQNASGGAAAGGAAVVGAAGLRPHSHHDAPGGVGEPVPVANARWSWNEAVAQQHAAGQRGGEY
ncbi:hypothetical protein HK101_002660 [Irineochytrium annulatum]|nr:hypothetical protein HK101_002660 [Irineochytrium annulatum]